MSVRRYLEVRRHSLKFKKGEGDTSQISPEGITRARRVAAEHMVGIRYDVAVHSEMTRTLETLLAFAEGGAQIPTSDAREEKLFGAPLEEWIRLCPKSEELQAIAEVDPVAFARITEEQATIYRRIARMVPAGGRALVVGNMPAIPMAVYGLTSGEAVISPLAECEGVLLTFEDDMVVDVKELRLP